VMEAAGEGDDHVVAFDHYAIRAGESVETLAAAEGSAAIILTGNALAQSLYGNSGANILTTGGGNDYLVGGGGTDTFVISNAPGIATIGDYAAGEAVDVTQFLSVAGGTNVTGGGYLRITSAGQLQVDANGGGDAWATIANVSGSSAVTVRYLSGGNATDLTVARSGQAQAMEGKTGAEADPFAIGFDGGFGGGPESGTDGLASYEPLQPTIDLGFADPFATHSDSFALV
jgi:Ca2+-binding RTX toxin-like protein